MSLSIQVDQHDGDGDSGNKSAGRWTQEEHNLFLQGLQTHQKQWKLIADMVKTRTVVQIRTHAQKYFQKLHKTNGWNKHGCDDSNSPFSEHDGQRSFAFPTADARAGSFCSSGDSVDSNGTSGDGGDSEGEVLGQRPQQQGGRPRPTVNATYGYELNGSNSTSTTNSTLSSPTGGSYHHNAFIAQQQLQQQKRQQVQQQQAQNVLKVKNDLVRKRSRESLKSMVGVEAKMSPKKGAFGESHSPRNRPDPDVHPNRGHTANSPNVSFRLGGYGTNTAGGVNAGHFHDHVYGGGMPGPLMGLPDDLGLGLGLGLDGGSDLLFPSGAFPDDPTGYSYGVPLGCTSTDTDLTNPSAHYFSQILAATNGGLIDHDAPDFDDADFLNILENIDWTEPAPSAESVSSTTTNSRPLSPITDSASTVSSVPVRVGGVVAAAASAKAPSPMPAAQNTSSATAAAPVSEQGQADDAPVPKKHRVAFSNVLEELELVSQAVRDNNSTSAPHRDADHISLFDLFQRDGSQTVGRLPPLRALVQQARERSTRKVSVKSESAPATGAVSENGAAAGATEDFDAHDFDFGNFMGDDLHDETHAMDCSHGLSADRQQEVPTSVPPPPPPAQRSGSGNLFPSGASILDANGAINASGTLLTINMMPSNSAPSSANNTPAVAQRKRGRPRKNSATNPPSHASTPGAATAKSLLPALTHSVNGATFQGHSLPEGQGYIVPVNAAVAQAYSYAVGSQFVPTDYHPAQQQGRSLSTDSTNSTGIPCLSAYRLAAHAGSGEIPLQAYHGYGTNVRLGMTRTMSSESDNMMAAVFDPKLYDPTELGMLEDFE